MAVKLVRNKLLLLCAVLVTTAWSAKQLEECSTSCKYVGGIALIWNRLSISIRHMHYVHCLLYKVVCVFCSLGLVESIPEDLPYPSGAPSHLSTFRAWMSLLNAATSSLDIASYYWTLLGRGEVKDPTDIEVTLLSSFCAVNIEVGLLQFSTALILTTGKNYI